MGGIQSEKVKLRGSFRLPQEKVADSSELYNNANGVARHQTVLELILELSTAEAHKAAMHADGIHDKD